MSQPTALFSDTFDLPLTDIHADPARFQGRLGEFSEDTVNAIVGKGHYDRSKSPITVWRDPANGKFYILSGHSRFEAAKRIYASGKQPELASLPVKQMMVDDVTAAIEYAVLESNRKSTEEGLVPDIMAYRKAVELGKNSAYLKSIFRPDSRFQRLKELSKLNPKGMFIEQLAAASQHSFPYLERNARWVGNMRAQFPALTDLHERELFDYLYGSKKALNITKQQFFDLVNSKVSRIDFDPANALNLANRISPTAYTDPLNEQLREIDKDIAATEREIQNLRTTLARAKSEGIAPPLVASTNQVGRITMEARIGELNNHIVTKYQAKAKLQQDAGRLERTMGADLFSMMEEPAPAQAPKQVERKFKIGDRVKYFGSGHYRIGTITGYADDKENMPENYWVRFDGESKNVFYKGQRLEPINTVVEKPGTIREEDKMQFGTGYKDYDFELAEIPTKRLIITEFPSISEREDLITDIKINGIKKPIVVVTNDNSEMYYVKNGNHRTAIAKHLNIGTVPALIATQKEPKAPDNILSSAQGPVDFQRIVRVEDTRFGVFPVVRITMDELKKGKSATSRDFHVSTAAPWYSVSGIDFEADYISESGSEYMYSDTHCYRRSDHWGYSISSCVWPLNGGMYNKMAIGACRWEDFHKLVDTRFPKSQEAKRAAEIVGSALTDGARWHLVKPFVDDSKVERIEMEIETVVPEFEGKRPIESKQPRPDSNAAAAVWVNSLPLGTQITSTLRDYGQAYTLTKVDGDRFFLGDKDGSPLKDGGRIITHKEIMFLFKEELEAATQKEGQKEAKEVKQAPEPMPWNPFDDWEKDLIRARKTYLANFDDKTREAHRKALGSEWLKIWSDLPRLVAHINEWRAGRPDIKPPQPREINPSFTKTSTMKDQIIAKVNAETDPWQRQRTIDNIAYSFAGPRQQDTRQRVLLELTGNQYPKAKAGVHEIQKVITELVGETPDPLPVPVVEKVAQPAPIRTLGTGDAVYYDSFPHYRVNDSMSGKVYLNVGADYMLVPAKTLEYDTAKEAVEMAKKFEARWPKGVPQGLDVVKAAEQMAQDETILDIDEKMEDRKVSSFSTHVTPHPRFSTLYVASYPDRVSKQQFDADLARAKKLGGWYSSYNKNGAVAGFQFKTEKALQDFTGLMAPLEPSALQAPKNEAPTAPEKDWTLPYGEIPYFNFEASYDKLYNINGLTPTEELVAMGILRLVEWDKVYNRFNKKVGKLKSDKYDKIGIYDSYIKDYNNQNRKGIVGLATNVAGRMVKSHVAVLNVSPLDVEWAKNKHAEAAREKHGPELRAAAKALAGEATYAFEVGDIVTFRSKRWEVVEKRGDGLAGPRYIIRELGTVRELGVHEKEITPPAYTHRYKVGTFVILKSDKAAQPHLVESYHTCAAGNNCYRISPYPNGKAEGLVDEDELLIYSTTAGGKPETYFDLPANAVNIPLANVYSTKDNKESSYIVAASRMREAANGWIPKRGPITVEKMPDGRHHIKDGNATFEVAKRSGWDYIPAVVVNEQNPQMNDPKRKRMLMMAKAAAARARALSI